MLGLFILNSDLLVVVSDCMCPIMLTIVDYTKIMDIDKMYCQEQEL